MNIHMLKHPTLLALLLLLATIQVTGQSSIDDLLERYNTRSIRYITVQELRMHPDDYLILDTRKKEEFEVSHIPGAVWAGDSAEIAVTKNSILDVQKNQPIVVYCSVGIRSEKFGEKLKDMGYTEVQNLYGSIFAWKNADFPVIDSLGQETQNVHVFSKRWANYLLRGEKIY